MLDKALKVLERLVAFPSVSGTPNHDIVDFLKKYIDASYKLIKIKASHWLIQDSFDLISKEVLTHLKG